MIGTVHVWITSVCDRMCRDCCQRLRGRPAGEHFPWAAFERAARHLAGRPICVIGGEPTLHPEFDRVAREFHRLFATSYVELATNGHGVVEHGASVELFDHVKITSYPSRRAQAAVAWLRESMPDRVTIVPADHVPLARIGGGRPCARADHPAVVGDVVYPCCVGPGFAADGAVALDDGWEARLAAAPLPCARCVFSLPEACHLDD